MPSFIEILKAYWKPVSVIVGTISLLITIIKIIANSYAINKIQNNELKHLTKDVDDIKEEEKDFKKELKEELHDINLAVRRIEKKVVKNSTLIKVLKEKK